MKNNKHFKKFEGIISLNPSRENRIDSAYTTWNDRFKDDEVLSDKFKDFFLQGSYSTNTAIKPLKENDEYDVDVVLLLGYKEKPKELLLLIAKRIKSDKKYVNMVKIKDRCVRIDYAGEFHMDIVPAKLYNDDCIKIPCKSKEDWTKTNPAGFTKWFKEKNEKSNYMLQKIVKFIKYWRDSKVGKDTAPKSILLTTLVALNFKGTNCAAESLVLTLENLIANLDNILDNNGEPYVENPSLKKENLARDWNKEKYDIFKKKLTKFAEDARDALDEKDESLSIKKWQNIFDKFPSTVEEATAAEMTSSGKMFVNAMGNINPHVGKTIPNHRFYGSKEV